MPRMRPPRDSWIAIEPGASFAFDREAMGTAQQASAKFGREVRGAVLAYGFEAEWIIDQILVQAFMPKPEVADTSRSLFDELFLKKSPLRFAHKIRILKAVHAANTTLQEALPATVLPKLDELRSKRNDFAHYPVTLIPTGPEPIRELTPVLVATDGDIELTPEVVQGMFRRFAEVIQALDVALGKLLPPTEGEA